MLLNLYAPVRSKYGAYMVLSLHINHKDYYGQGEGGRGYGGGVRGRLYTYRYTVTTRMTPALRWAAMRVILMFH